MPYFEYAVEVLEHAGLFWSKSVREVGTHHGEEINHQLQTTRSKGQVFCGDCLQPHQLESPSSENQLARTRVKHLKDIK